jgi:hypothetical protein
MYANHIAYLVYHYQFSCSTWNGSSLLLLHGKMQSQPPTQPPYYRSFQALIMAKGKQQASGGGKKGKGGGEGLHTTITI